MSYQQNRGHGHQGGGYSKGGKPEGVAEWVKTKFKSSWIDQQIDRDGIDYADKLGEYLKNEGFTTSQIRNVFGEVRRIQMKGYAENKTAFLLLRPKVAYAAKRAGKTGAEAFKTVLDLAHNQVTDDEKTFQNFCDFIEAILAYHKAYGGKD
ncbi:MAG: type III-A CRISPR-associated protein Csm2 [Catalinimonas sp.]